MKTRIGAIAFKAPTNKSPKIEAKPIPGTHKPNRTPAITPMRIFTTNGEFLKKFLAFFKLLAFHFHATRFLK